MITIRAYDEGDAVAAGVLIADTFGKYNLSHLAPPKQKELLGPFAYARSESDVHRKAIADAIDAPIVLVAKDGSEVMGILRGGHSGRLNSLFVHEAYHRQGIGRRLVIALEEMMIARRARVIRLAATPYAVPFYLRVGYRRSTGMRETDEALAQL